MRLPEGPHRAMLAVVAVVVVATLAGLVALWPPPAELPAQVGGERVRAEVTGLEVTHEDPWRPGERYANVTVELTSGTESGRVVDLEDVPLSAFPPFAVGDRLELERSGVAGSSMEFYIRDFRRLPALGWLLGVFVLAVLAVGRWHGLRALAGLGFSLATVVGFVVPAVLAGRSPALVALVASCAVMVVTLYLTHGFNEQTTAAVVGTTAALALTVGVGVWAIEGARITGFASENAMMAGFAVNGLNLRGLVLAGLIISALGVLDDVTVSQSSTVFALRDAAPDLGVRELFIRAMRVGRDHISSVVNTLFLAYTGASLALLVLFTSSAIPAGDVVNSEVVAEELVKILVGSVGLIAAVPLTTLLAAVVAAGSSKAQTPAA